MATRKIFQSLGPGYAVQLEAHENIKDGLEIAAAGFLQRDELLSLRQAIDLWLGTRTEEPWRDDPFAVLKAQRIAFAVLNTIDISEAWESARRDPDAIRNAVSHVVGRELAIAAAASAFVKAHCQLEDLARREGAGRASQSRLNERVIDAHLELERVVLGDEAVPGRRSKL